jgi:hypothetical protein
MSHSTHSTALSVPEQILAGRFKQVAIWKTAGGGKTDFVVYFMDRCRALKVPCISLVLNVDARDEGRDRGMTTLEANNWHAFEKRNLEMKLGAIINYQNAEKDPTSKYDKMRLVLDPCQAKMRLLLRLVLKDMYMEPLRVPLHKIFSEFVVHLSRCVRDAPVRTRTRQCQCKPASFTHPSVLYTGQAQRPRRQRPAASRRLCCSSH